MPRDPELIDETRAWLVRAHRDLGMGRAVLDARPSYPDGAAFHAQQAVEKSVKGLLTWHGRVFRKTHDLGELGRLGVAVDPTLEPSLRSAAPLSEFAWRFRYPGDLEEPSQAEAEEALELAREVHEAVLARLPKDIDPERGGAA